MSYILRQKLFFDKFIYNNINQYIDHHAKEKRQKREAINRDILLATNNTENRCGLCYEQSRRQISFIDCTCGFCGRLMCTSCECNCQYNFN